MIKDNTHKIGDTAKKDLSALPGPSYCCFVLTLSCMMRCKMCNIWSQKEDYSNELTIKDWKDCVSSLKGLLDPSYGIILSGGEPFLKEGILDLTSFIARSGYKVSIDTNAYLINEDMAKAIRDSGVWRICISLDSLDKDSHDFLRGKSGSFNRILKAIEHLHKHSPLVGINIQTVITAQNLDGLVNLAKWVEQDERLDYIYFQAVVRPFGTQADADWFREGGFSFLWPQNINKVRAVMDDLIKLTDANSKIVNIASQLKAYAAYFEDPVNFAKDVNCTIGHRDININPYGDMYLCFKKDSMGNVKAHSISNMWHSEKAYAIREKIDRCKQPCHFLLNCSFSEGDCS